MNNPNTYQAELQHVIRNHIKEHREFSRERFKWKNVPLRFYTSLFKRNHLTSIQRQIADSGLEWMEKRLVQQPEMRKEVRAEILARKQTNAHLSESLTFISTLLWFVSFLGLVSILKISSDLGSLIVFICTLFGAVFAVFAIIAIRTEILENDYIISLLEEY